MIYLAKSPELVNTLKNSSNYTEQIKQKILNSSVIDEKTKYDAGLPFYLIHNSVSTYDDFDLTMSSVVANRNFNDLEIARYGALASMTITADYYGTSVIASTKNSIDLSKYNKMDINCSGWVSPTVENILTGTLDVIINGLPYRVQNSTSLASFKFSKLENKNLSVNINSINNGYIKFRVTHGLENESYSASISIINVALM